MPDHHALLYIARAITDTPLDTPRLATLTEIERISVPILTIAMVRQVIQSAMNKPFEKSIKTIILEVGQIAPEAQHALLKVFEEPPATTKFIVVIPSAEGLLPTLLSRLYRPGLNDTAHTEQSAAFQAFLHQSYAERLTTILELTKAKDTSGLEQLLADLIVWLRQATPGTVRTHMLWCATQLPLRGAAKKMLWEEIALSLPVEL